MQSRQLRDSTAIKVLDQTLRDRKIIGPDDTVMSQTFRDNHPGVSVSVAIEAILRLESLYHDAEQVPQTRDRTQYQMMVDRGEGLSIIKLAEATRGELEGEMMRAFDVIQQLENKLEPLTLLLNNFLSGHNKEVDRAVAEKVDD